MTNQEFHKNHSRDGGCCNVDQIVSDQNGTERFCKVFTDFICDFIDPFGGIFGETFQPQFADGVEHDLRAGKERGE